MKILPIILLVALVGCNNQPPMNTASRMNRQIQQWIPKGMTLATARQSMEQHQFACTVGSYDSRAAMPTGSDRRWWDVGSYITSGGKTLPVTNVTILTCKRAETTNDASVYEATLTIVDGEFDGAYLVVAQRVR